jgi:hypothetical protein
MIDYPDTRQMLMEGHLTMDSKQAEVAMVAFGQWLESRHSYLKERDPQGLVALWAELHID